MNKKQKSNLKKKITNFFGAAGYLLCAIQWLWVFVLYSSIFIGVAKEMSADVTKEVPAGSPVIIDLSTSVPMLIITAVIVIFMIGLTVYILIKIPSTLMNSTKDVVQTVAKGAAPLVLKSQNKNVSKRNLFELTPKLIFTMKILLIVAPVILAFMSKYVDKQLFEIFISMYVAVFLACVTTLMFVFQYLTAELMLVKKQDIL